MITIQKSFGNKLGPINKPTPMKVYENGVLTNDMEVVMNTWGKDFKNVYAKPQGLGNVVDEEFLYNNPDEENTSTNERDLLCNNS